ncbi:MAG: hypothetical protein ACYTGH_02515, partial [Planctomycetota bacterium]
LNKVDAVDESEAAAVEEKIRGIRGDVEIRPTSFLSPEPAQAFCETLMNRIEEHRSAAISMPEPEAAGDPNKIPGGVAHAEDLNLVFDPEVGGEGLAGRMKEIATILGARLETERATLIGHIKSVVRSPGGGFLMTSLTDFGQDPMQKGRLPKRVASADIRLNVIAFGVDKQRVDEVVKEVLEQQLQMTN